MNLLKQFTLLLLLAAHVPLGAPVLVTQQMPALKEYFSGVAAGGKIFLAGGFNGTYTNKVDIFDVSTQAWRMDSLSQTRSMIATAVVGDLVLFAGGENSSIQTNRVDIFNVSSNAWSISTMPLKKTNMRSAVIGDNVYFIGGYLYPTDSINTMMIFHAPTATWSVKTVPTVRYGVGVTSIGTKIVMAGGYDQSGTDLKSVDIYDTATDTWSEIQMPAARFGQKCFSANNKLYFAGGIKPDYLAAGSIYIYNMGTGAWSTKNMAIVRSEPAISMLAQKIYIAGGRSGFDTQYSVEVLNTFNDVFESEEFLSDARLEIVPIRTSNQIYFCGGRRPVSVITDELTATIDVLTLDPSGTNSISPQSLMLSPSIAQDILYVKGLSKEGKDDPLFVLSDLLGRTFTRLAEQTEAGDYMLRVADLPPGSYIVSCSQTGTRYVARFMKVAE